MSGKGKTMENRIKQAFKEKRAALGLFIGITSPALVEIAGYCNFDFVILDTEHSPASEMDIENMVRAAECVGVTPIVRVTNNDRGLILRALDVGSLGILVPHVVSQLEAQAAVTTVKYPPEGIRSLATTTRAGRYRFRSVEEHVQWSNRETLVALQIEDKVAVGVAGDIAKVAGVDVIFVGSSDLALSIGFPGQTEHFAVQEAIEQVFKKAKECNREVGILVRNAEEAKKMVEQEVRFLAFSSTIIIASVLKDLVCSVREVLP